MGVNLLPEVDKFMDEPFNLTSSNITWYCGISYVVIFLYSVLLTLALINVYKVLLI